MYRFRSFAFALLRPVFVPAKPMIFPPVFVVVFSHVSIEKVCGPDPQNLDAPCTGAVFVVPGKFVAGSDSFRSAPGTLRLFVLFKIRSFDPARSNAVVPLDSPIRHSQSGSSARTAAA